MRVLVVDDDPIVLASCRRVLETNGFDVVTAASVSAAIVETVSQGFGLVLEVFEGPVFTGRGGLGHVWEVPAIGCLSFRALDLSFRARSLRHQRPHIGMDAAALRKYPQSGGVFRMKTNVKGMPTFEFGN